MPLRAYRCDKCGYEQDELYRVGQKYPLIIQCGRCTEKSYYIYADTYYRKLQDRQPKRYKVDFHSGQYDLGAGRVFNSKSERDRWMKETGTTRRKDME